MQLQDNSILIFQCKKCQDAFPHITLRNVFLFQNDDADEEKSESVADQNDMVDEESSMQQQDSTDGKSESTKKDTSKITFS